MKLYVMFALVGNWSDSHLYEKIMIHLCSPTCMGLFQRDIECLMQISYYYVTLSFQNHDTQ